MHVPRELNLDVKPVKRFAVIDIETDPFKYGEFPEPFAACFYVAPDDENPGETIVFWGNDCIQKLVTRCKKWRGIIYAHNGGKFDFHFLLEYLPLRNSEALCIGPRIVQLKFEGGYEFRDSFALIPLPLASWGKISIDIQKLSKSRRETNKPEIINYLKHDCSYLSEMLKNFFDKWGQKLTLASTTFDIFQRGFGYKIPRLEASDDARMRRHYFAGRVQYFALGRLQGPFTMLDINSAFPWAMTQNHWISPSGKYDIVKGAPKKNFDQSLISCRCLAGGSLPYRNSDKGVSFPENTYPLEFFCTGWEIRAGLETGAIKDLAINYSLTPRKTESFAAFVNYFYEMKKRAKAEGRKADEYHAKLFLNSCYGKMGLDISKFRDVAFRSYYDAPEEKGWEEHWHDERRGLSAYERPSSEGPRGKFSKFYCIAIAASVTGLVRAFLWRSIASVSGIQYCDTDSIICESPKKLQVGAELGEWKHEMDIDWLWIGGKKLYAAHDAEYPWLKCVPKGEKKKDYVNVKGLGFTKREAFKTAAKGVRLSIEKIISICEGSTREGKFDAPSYSANGIPRFTKRKIRRADKREI